MQNCQLNIMQRPDHIDNIKVYASVVYFKSLITVEITRGTRNTCFFGVFWIPL